VITGKSVTKGALSIGKWLENHKMLDKEFPTTTLYRHREAGTGTHLANEVFISRRRTDRKNVKTVVFGENETGRLRT
jgi:hypothetical protein